MVDAQAEAREDKQSHQPRHEGAVQGQVAGQLARDAEVVDLRCGDAEDQGDDDGECEGRSRLGSDVVRRQPLDGDQGREGVVVEHADEAGAQVEEGFFELGVEVGEGGARAVAV